MTVDMVENSFLWKPQTIGRERSPSSHQLFSDMLEMVSAFPGQVSRVGPITASAILFSNRSLQP